MPATAVRVEGLAALQRALSTTDKHLAKGVKEAFVEAAEPIGKDAEGRAPSVFKSGNLGRWPRWSRFRVGVSRTEVYIVPQERGSTGPRHRGQEFAVPVFDRAMWPALEAGAEKLESAAAEALDDLFRRYAKWTLHG